MNVRLLLLLLLAVISTGCSSASQLAATAQPGFPRVVAAEPFLADIAQDVAGGRLPVETLLRPGVDPHEFQPAPQDAIKIDQARVLIVNGLGYETWLTASLGNAGSQHLVVTASDGLSPTTSASGSPDPHMWMNPLNVVRYVENIRDGLTQADPAGKDAYATNADAYVARLKDLDGWIKGQVVQLPPEKRMLVTSHDSLGYFAQAYGFKVVGAVTPSVTDEASPSAQQMAALIDTIKSTGAPAVFLDPTENRNLAEQIASATGARVVTDLYVESLSAASGPAPTYIDMLKHDVTVIVEALK